MGVKKTTMTAWLVVALMHVYRVSATTCAIDNTLPETAAGNSYECPDVLDDGTDNEFNVCCWNDRPDESGNFHTCCKDEAAADAEKMQEFYNICIIIGAVTGALMIGVFTCTYVKEDTFPCIKVIRRTTRKYYNLFMDALCFCSCLPKRFRRSAHRDDAPQQDKKKSRRRDNFDMPPSSDDQELVVDPFWA